MSEHMASAVSLEVFRHRLQAIAEEMGATLVRTAHSVNIKDRKDCSAAVYTTRGELIAQAEHIPLHLGLMPSVVKAVLAEHPIEEWRPGDAFITNDPYLTGTHCPDVCVLSAVHHRGRPVAIVANLAHHADVGGSVPGSLWPQATEVFHEGLRLPPVLLQRGGELDRGLLAILTANSRTGRELQGDLLAQVACNRVGAQRLAELVARQGVDYLEAHTEALFAYSEGRARRALAVLPPGSYEFEDVIEGDGLSDDPVRIRVRVGLHEGRLLVDFSGTSPQTRGPLNAARPGTLACVYFVLKAVFDPDLPSNEGIGRVVEVHIPEGSLLDARYPAPVGSFNPVTSQRVVDTLLGALARAVPQRVIAASTGSMNALLIGGRHPATGRLYSYVETYGGGQGAMAGLDGMDGVHTNMTNTLNTPVEVIEQDYPLLVTEYALVADSEGPGEFRGGLGLTRELEVLEGEAVVSVMTDRARVAPWGLAGGGAGGCSRCLLRLPDGTTRLLPSKTSLEVPAGARVRLVTAGGGGWGNPRARDRVALAREVRAGLLSRARAATVYGFSDEEVPSER